MTLKAKCSNKNIAFLLCLSLFGLIYGFLCKVAAAQELTDRSQISLLPCLQQCAPMQWRRMLVYQSGREQPIMLPTSMTKVQEVAVSATGYIIIRGSLDEKLTVISLVDPIAGKMLAEFWTYASGISPDNQYIAFTAFVAAHGELSSYSNKMVYVLDVKLANRSPGGWISVPKNAVPVFPRSLISQGKPFIMHLSADHLTTVASTNFSWTSSSSFTFITSGGQIEGSNLGLVPVKITSTGNDWSHAVISVEPALRCDPVSRDVSTMISACGE